MDARRIATNLSPAQRALIGKLSGEWSEISARERTSGFVLAELKIAPCIFARIVEVRSPIGWHDKPKARLTSLGLEIAVVLTPERAAA